MPFARTRVEGVRCVAFCHRLVDDYADYTRSFVNIRDPRIEAHVEQELKDGLLWPDPIVQLNPAFESGGHVGEAVAEGLLDQTQMHHRCRAPQNSCTCKRTAAARPRPAKSRRDTDGHGSSRRAPPSLRIRWD
jgi:hypothetical protein